MDFVFELAKQRLIFRAYPGDTGWTLGAQYPATDFDEMSHRSDELQQMRLDKATCHPFCPSTALAGES
jgi:hypothetical protein